MLLQRDLGAIGFVSFFGGAGLGELAVGSEVRLFGRSGPTIASAHGGGAEVGDDSGIWVRFVNFGWRGDVIEREGFEAASAVEAPAGLGELGDEELLVCGDGLELGAIARQEPVVPGLVFVKEGLHFVFRVEGGASGWRGLERRVRAAGDCGAGS